MDARHPNDPPVERRVERPVQRTVEREPIGGGSDVAAVEPSFRDRIRWGPIVAGVFTALTTLVVMTVLGLAIGLSAFEPDEAGSTTVGTAAAIWGILSAVLAFFLGGWVAGRNALGTAEDNGAINGFLVGAATIAVMLWMIGTGLGNLMGLAGTNIDEISQVTGQPVSRVEPGEVTDDAGAVVQDSYDEARDSAWGTLAGLIVALSAATAGGALGHPDRTMITTRGPTRRPATQTR
jgi:hypothetical protein